ncbi:MAG: M90 family metallopeptidase [Pseudomonadota bacterium]
MGIFLFISIWILFFLLWIIKLEWRNHRRKILLQKELSHDWVEIIERNVALYKFLPDDLKKQLHRHMQVFLAEKYFEGCGGLKITDEIKVTIAAQACILLLNRDKITYFPLLSSILVYPSAYVAEQRVQIGITYITEPSARLGESWDRGTVVLAWDHVKQCTMDFKGGHNVVLHEFAHQLDQESGQANGAPLLEKRSSYAMWAHVLTEEYQHLRSAMMHHEKDIMDFYGATNPAEFFAVATETFFEKAILMKKIHPKLYEELKEFYRLDPAEWFEQ